ncbi:MAG: DMT family transporter [Candidatus Nanohaloarchaea archaeon]|nr:DMT family transporter [Candidatus Nanohaloarchaea archaeon]
MLWLYAALLSGIAFGVIFLLANHVMERTSSFDFAALFSIIGAVLYAPIFLYLLPRTSLAFAGLPLVALAASGLANTAGVLASNAAIKAGEVSTVTPLVRTQPVFAALLGFLFLGESLHPVKLAGIGLVTVGGYLVLLREETALLEPVRQLGKNISPQLAVLSGFLFAIGAVADRFATQTISPRVYTFLLLAFIAVAFVAYIGLRRPDKFSDLRASFQRHRLAYIFVGGLTVVAYYSVITALSRAEASRVVPVLQVQVFVGVIGGSLFFEEEGMWRKLVGSVLLIAGVALVV